MQNKDLFKYRADIDGLRAIAVSIVVAYHASFSGFSGGYVGVDVFFVISGFLITGLLFKEVDRTGKISLLSFYAKRFKRLYPALLFVVISVIVLWGIFFIDVPASTTTFINSIRYSIFGFANIFFKNNTGGYFDMASDEMPLLHFWSLAVEEQFYFVWPFLILICSKLSFGFRTVKSRVIFILSTVSILSFILSEFFIASNYGNEAFYSMPARAWELGIGGLLYFIYPECKKINISVLNGMGILGLILIFGSSFFYEVDSRFPGSLALLPVIGTVLIILSGGHAQTSISKLLSDSRMVHIGLLSYGWYLWHWPLLAFGRIYFLGAVPPLSWRIGAVILSLILSKISLELIEKPVRFGKKINGMKAVNVLAFALSTSVLVVLISLGLKLVEKYRMPPNFAQIAKYAEEKNPAELGCDGSSKTAKGKSCVVNFVNAETKSLPEIIIWGDSHSRSYFPMFTKFAKDEKLKVSLLSGSDMTPLLGVKELYFSNKRETKKIGVQNNNIVHNLKAKLAVNAVSVVLISRWVIFTGAKTISVKDRRTYLEKSKDANRSIEIFRESINRTLKTITDMGVQKILIVLPTPEFKFEVLKCHSKIKCDTPRKVFETYRAKAMSILKEAASRYKQVRLIDPVSVFCSHETCPQIIVNDHGVEIPTVEDDDHVSVPGALFFGRKIKHDLDWLVEI